MADFDFTGTREIVLGEKYRDKISGFEGVATGVVKYITGCVQVLLEGPHDPATGKQRSGYFDDLRLEDVAPQAGSKGAGLAAPMSSGQHP